MAAELVLASGEDGSCLPLFGGFSTHLEGQAGEDPVPIGENISHVVWGKPQDPPGETGKCCWVKDLDYHRNLLPPHPNQVGGG